MAFVDELSAKLAMLAVGKTLADRPHASADPIARVEDGHRRVGSELMGGGQARQARAGDHHVTGTHTS
jgi:hypothetical protein